VATATQATARNRARFLALSASVVVAAHVSALSWNGHAQSPSGGSPGAPAIDVLWVREAVRPVAPSEPDGAAAAPARPTEHRELAANGRPAQEAAPVGLSKAAAKSSASEGIAAGESLEYLPRAKLTVAPAPLEPIEIPFPAAVDNPLRFRGQLSLFIDEHGVVQRIRVDGPPMPPVLEEAARNAFLRARFTPGEVDGVAVRSLIRIEVDFEAELRKEEADRPT
jgi:hypothetical protein